MTFVCAICGRTGHKTFMARERMLGLGDSFEYGECVACGCLHLITIPKDFSRYYPADYYAVKPEAPWKRSLRITRLAQGLGRRSLLGALLVRIFGPPDASAEWLQHVTLESRILDVGCGRGDLVRALRRIGFRHVTGLDPYIGNDVVERAAVSDVAGQYDLVMLHHSLEHMPPRDAFPTLRKLLAPDGWCLVRTPVADSYAWRTYGAHWVQLDAPRHLVVYTRRGLEFAANAAGLRLARVVDDSTAFQFWGSERYMRNLPLTRGRVCVCLKDLRRFAARARALNASGAGDQVCAFFTPGG